MMKINRRTALAGFTLIETMIAVAISALVMAALIEVFSSQQQMYYRQSSLAQAQANARASLSMVSRDVRMAGYIGLPLGFAHINSSTLGSGPGSIFAVMSLQNNGTKLAPGAATGLVISSGTVATAVHNVSDTVPPGGDNIPDAFEIFGNFARGMANLSTSITENTAVTTISIPSTGLSLFQNTGFNRPAFVAVGNNDRTEIFTFVSAPTTGTGTVALTVSGLSHADYKATSMLGGEATRVDPIFRRVYFVNTKNVLDANGALTGTLFVANYNAAGALAGNSVELSRDVQEFQVDYDVRNTNNWTVTQNTITDPCAVVGVRLRIRNKGWVSSDGKQKMNRDLVSVIRIRNSGLGAISCPVL